MTDTKPDAFQRPDDEGRVFLTPAEIEAIVGVGDRNQSTVYKLKNTAHRRAVKRLPYELPILKEHYPEFYDDVVELICEDAQFDLGQSESAHQSVVESHELSPEEAEDLEVGLSISHGGSEDSLVKGKDNEPATYHLVKVVEPPEADSDQ